MVPALRCDDLEYILSQPEKEQLCSKAFYQFGQIISTAFGRHCKEHFARCPIGMGINHRLKYLQTSVSPSFSTGRKSCTPWPFSSRQESRISKPNHLYYWSRSSTGAFFLLTLLYGIKQESYLLIFNYRYNKSKNQKNVYLIQTGVFKE